MLSAAQTACRLKRKIISSKIVRKFDSKYKWVLVVFSGALLLRLIYFFQIKAGFPGWDTPTIDPLYHDLWAKQIASGDIIGSGPFFRAPFYAYFLGAIYAIAGPSLAIAKIIQHVIGSLSCSLIFLFTDRYFNRATAILSGLISAFYWVFIYFEDELLLDSLLVLFSVLLIWLLMRAREKPTLGRFFISGLILGIAAITRPNFAAFIPVVLIWMIFYLPSNFKITVSRFAVFLAGSLLIIMPVTVRNILVGDDMVIIASQGGINFYIGNNEHADGMSAIMPEFGSTWQYTDCEYLAGIETGRPGYEIKQSEVSSFFYLKALNFIIEEPALWLGLMFRKLDYFWNAYEISNNQNLYFFRQFASVTRILPPLFFIISPLSIYGLWLIFRDDRKYHLIGYFIIIYMLSIIAFFVTSRFRLPIVPFLIILSSYALFRIIAILRKGDLRKRAGIAIWLLILFFFTNLDLFGISHTSFAMSHYSLGNVYLKKGMNDKALGEYAAALKLADCVPSAHLNRGIIYFGSGDFSKAREEFEKEIAACGRSSKAHNNLSVLNRFDGDLNGALGEARLAIAESPQQPEARVNEILALRMLGAREEAVQAIDSLVLLFPDYHPGRYFMGKMAIEAGRTDLAEAEFKYILTSGNSGALAKYDLSSIYSSRIPYGYKEERMPGLACYELGLIEVSRGRVDSALVLFKRTSKILPDYADGWANLALAYDYKGDYQEALAAFKKSLDLKPENPVVLYNLGLTLGKTGMLSEAADVFRIAIDIKPDFAEARDKLKITESLLESSGQQR